MLSAGGVINETIQWVLHAKQTDIKFTSNYSLLGDDVQISKKAKLLWIENE
jgi:hypothetical protein